MINRNTRSRKNHHAFRPTLDGSPLEDRLVLATSGAAQALVVTPPPAQPPVSVATAIARVRHAILQQTRLTSSSVRSAINAQIAALYANGNPTAQQMADFNASVMGISNAVALQLSTQAGLLPGASARLVPGLQNFLLGARSNSLINRMQALTTTPSSSASALQAAVSRQLNSAFQGVSNQFNSFFRTTNLNQLSVGPNGGRVTLPTFMSNQLLTQVGNSLGQLAQSFPGVATTALFPNGTVDVNGLPIVPTQDALNAFNQQATNALRVVAFQLGSGLSIFPNASQAATQIQPVLFGNGTNSFATALQNLPFGATNFNTAVTTAFNNGFQNLTTALSPFLATQIPQNAILPLRQFSSPSGPAVLGSSMISDFNNGFATAPGTGFIGFGQAPTSFNTNFGTAFNNLIGGMNTTFGFGTTTTGSGTTTIGSGTTTTGSGTTTSVV